MTIQNDLLAEKEEESGKKIFFSFSFFCPVSQRPCFRPWMAFFLLLVFSIPLPAAGYVLPGRLVLQLMLDNLNPPSAMAITQNVTLYNKDGGVEKVFTEHASYRPPACFRSESDYRSERRIHVEAVRSAVTLINGRIVPPSESISDAWMDLYKDIFCFRSPEGLADRLESSGLDVDVTSLGRFEDTVVYVIGDDYPRESAPQLWVYKDTFRPVRWIVISGADSEDGMDRDIRYLSWRRVNNTWYPGRIEFYVGDQMVKAIDVLHLDFDPGFPPGFFDVESIIANHAAGGSTSK